MALAGGVLVRSMIMLLLAEWPKLGLRAVALGGELPIERSIAVLRSQLVSPTTSTDNATSNELSVCLSTDTVNWLYFIIK